MPHFPEYNLLFIHIPKTGGTSFEEYMLDRTRTRLWSNLNIFPEPNLNKISLQHQTYQTIYKYRELLEIEFNDKLKKLAFVRNPYDRIVSDIFWFEFNTETDSQEEIYDTIRHHYFGRDDLDNHNVPQYKFVTDENEKLIPDITLLKMENLTEGLQKYGFTDYEGPSQSNSYMKYLNKDSIRIINLFYKKDFEMFGYPMIE